MIGITWNMQFMRVLKKISIGIQPFSLDVLAFWSHLSPDRGAPGVWVPSGKQHLYLVEFKSHSTLLAARPPFETTLRKTLLTKPKSLAVVTKGANGSVTAVSEKKHSAAKRVICEHLST
jgi:hypothetical protein